MKYYYVKDTRSVRAFPLGSATTRRGGLDDRDIMQFVAVLVPRRPNVDLRFLLFRRGSLWSEVGCEWICAGGVLVCVSGIVFVFTSWCD